MRERVKKTICVTVKYTTVGLRTMMTMNVVTFRDFVYHAI